MGVSVMLHLFGKPAWELGKEGEEVESGELRALGDSLRERLHAAADAVERLMAKGWDAQLMLYDMTLSHPYINTEADARTHIADLGLDPEDFSYLEFEDEEWEEGAEGEEYEE